MGRFWEFLSNLPLGNINILLVDDNENFVNTLAERIRLKGYDSLIALNGREALEIARSNKIQMAVVDHDMPDMDGLVVITKLKEIDPTIHTCCSRDTVMKNSGRRPRHSIPNILKKRR
jgi:DNA-binding response OmpR family regulator